MNTEYIADLTTEELENPSYVEAIFVEQNKDDSIVTKESRKSHLNKLLTLIMIEILWMIAEFEILDKHTHFIDKIDDELLKEKPELIDTDSIEEKIKTKQLMFERYPYDFDID